KPEPELRLAVTDHLLRTFQEGGRTTLLVDEAHLLSPDLLDELRLLGNLESRGGKALQVVLLGLPALAATLARPELGARRQRVAGPAAAGRGGGLRAAPPPRRRRRARGAAARRGAGVAGPRRRRRPPPAQPGRPPGARARLGDEGGGRRRRGGPRGARPARPGR